MLNATNDKIKLVMEAGDFQTVSEASAKFLSAHSEINSNDTQINYFQRRFFQCYYNANHFRGNYPAYNPSYNDL